MRAFVITVSTAPSARVRWDCPMPSRMTFPPPNFTSSPYVVKSFWTSMTRSVSARRTRSPTVGPNICAYAARLISCGMGSILRPCRAHGGPLRQGAHDLLVEPEHAPRAAVRHEAHLAGLARLEPHGRPRRNVEATTQRRLSIERQRRVGLREMEMTAHLNGPVAGVRDGEP